MTRLRPVIMTALAMILGMLPMSLGLGEGGEQNAPLGRAVIGGLLARHRCTTLFFVPVMYSVLRRKPPDRRPDPLHGGRMTTAPPPPVARTEPRPGLRSAAARDQLSRDRARSSRPRRRWPSLAGAFVVRLPAAPCASERRSPRRPSRRGAAAMRVEVVAPKEGSSDRALSLPGQRAAARGDGHLRPRERLRAQVVRRHRRQGQGRPAPRGARHAGARPGARPGARAARPGAGLAACSRKANRELSKANLQRYKQLAPSGVVSQADVDQRQAMAQVDEANVSGGAGDHRGAAGEHPPPHAAQVVRARDRALRAAP